MQGLLSIFLLFGNKLNKFNNTRALMLHSINHMTLELLKITFLDWIRQDFVTFYGTLLNYYNNGCHKVT